MGGWELIIKFILMMFVICGFIITALYIIFNKRTDEAMQRLAKEAEKALAKQSELNQKIKEADEELEKRRKEANELAKKMVAEAESRSQEERERLIKKARDEGEEIIVKAQNATVKLRQDLEKEMGMKAIDYAVQLLNESFSGKVKGELDQQLIADFLDELGKVDMSKMAPDVKSAEVVTVNPIDKGQLNRLEKLLNEKLNRSVHLTATTDSKILGGVILKFGSLVLDGSLLNLFKETGGANKSKIDIQ